MDDDDQPDNAFVHTNSGIHNKPAYLVIAALLLLLMLLPFEWFLAKYTTLMIFIGLNTMVTVGLCLLMGYTGQVSLGHAAFFGVREPTSRPS